MSRSPNNVSPASLLGKVVVFVLVVAAVYFVSRYIPEAKQPAVKPVNEQVETAGKDKTPEKEREGPPAVTDDAPKFATRIDNVVIRDLEKRVVFRGTVDLDPTLARIDAGERLDFRNDGSVFQNREGRLPKQPSGHYREYVHVTEGLSGPGPQRVVVGADKEAYYTFDHYRTFRRIR